MKLLSNRAAALVAVVAIASSASAFTAPRVAPSIAR
jgi:hypothetical protein